MTLPLSELGTEWIRRSPQVRFDLARRSDLDGHEDRRRKEWEIEMEHRYQQCLAMNSVDLPSPVGLVALRTHLFWVEIKRRMDDVDSGKATLIPAEEVFAEAEAMLADIDGEEIGDVWDEEADRRYRAYLAGEMKAFPAEEVIAEARARLRH